MNAGDLRDRITIEAPVSGQDDVGGRVVSWVPWVPDWAAVETLSGAKLAYARGFAATVTHRVRMRWLDGVRADVHRVVYEGRVFAVTAALDPDNRRRELWLYCTEVVA